ncbi:MAG TPA: OstA-like protein [Chitinophagaceae bacterium]|nr:OstA-like protein [Chitinophagaceae bacterium]
MNVSRALKYPGLFALLIIYSTITHAQQNSAPADTVSKTQIIILNAASLNLLQKDSVNFTILSGGAEVKQDSTLFYADSIVLNRNLNTLEAFRHVHINDRDSVHTYSDYLKYLGREKKAHLQGNVKLTDGRGVLTTSELDYDVQSKTGVYTKGGKVVTERSVLTSKEAFYYGETRDVYFKKNVVMNDTDYSIKTDTLLYNTYTDVATFIVPTIITSGKNTRIFTTDGYYDKQNKKAYFDKRPDIQDGSTFLNADEVAYDSSGFGEARGTVIYRDTAQGATLLCNNLKTNKKESSFLATEKPVMMLKQDGDSIFIASDTMYSAKLSDLRKYRHVPQVVDSLPKKDSSALQNGSDSTDRFLEAYYHVRVFSDSLQAVGDSLFYSSEDSVFRLFKQPVVWSKDNQITGDTIYLFTKNKKPDRMYAFENALAINKLTDLYYNEVKGRTINGYFKDGNINYIRAKGNAESVYYGQDDENKFISVNKAKSDIIDMYFNEDKKPQKVVLRSNVEGTAYPMRQVNHEELRLRGFKWLNKIRPKSKEELLDGKHIEPLIIPPATPPGYAKN